MQIKEFIDSGNKGEFTEVIIVSRGGGYCIIAKKGDETAEIIRTQLGHPRIFKSWSTIKAKIEQAGILTFTVVG